MDVKAVPNLADLLLSTQVVTRVGITGGPVPLPWKAAGVLPLISVGAVSASGGQQPEVTASALHHTEKDLDF